MSTWQEKIKQHESEYHPHYANIIRCAKAYIEADHAVRSNPCGWKSCHGSKEDPIWAEYYRLSDIYHKAYSDLWIATDCEYGSEMTNAAWEWRYWSVMARKCCWYQLQSGNTEKASQTMQALHNAEVHLMEVCGLSDLYNPPQHYLEEAFPNLKKS